MPEIGEIFVKINGRLDDLEKKLDDSKRKSTQKGGEAGKAYAEEFGRKLNESLKKAGNALTLGVSLPMVAAGKSAFDAAMKMETLESSLKILTGSSAKAKKELADLRDVSQRVGGNFYSLAEASRGLIAGFSGNVKETNYVLENFTKLSSVIGISKADFDRLAINLTQIGGASRLMGDELRETAAILPNLRVLLKQAFGTSASEDLAKMGITGRQALLKISEAIEKSGLKPNLDTMRSKLNDFDNQMFQLRVTAGESLLPIANDFLKNQLVPAIKTTSEWLHKLTDEQKAGLLKWAAFAIAIGPVIKGFTLVADGIKGVIALKNAFVAAQAAQVAALKATEVQAYATAEAQTAANATAAGAGGAAGVAGKAGAVGFVAGRLLPMAAVLAGINAMVNTNSNAGSSQTIQMNDKILDLYERHLKTSGDDSAKFKAFRSGLSAIGADPKYAASYYQSAEKSYELRERLAMYQSTQGRAGDYDWTKELDKLPYGAPPKKEKEGHKKEEDELTKVILQGMARSITTPAGDASCAFFVSALMQKTGVQVGKIGGAKALIDTILKQGGTKVDSKDARAGDMVYYYGRQYGKIKDAQGNGYHVGMYAGDGYVIDSSGGKTRLNNTVHAGAHFIRPTRGGKFQNYGDLATMSLEAWEQMQEDLAEEQKRLVESLEPIRKLQNQKKSDKLKASGGMLYDVIAMREFGKNFLDLTDEANKNKVRAIGIQETEDAKSEAARDFFRRWAENNKLAKEVSDTKSRERDEVEGLIKSLQSELTKKENLSTVEMSLLKVKEMGVNLTQAQMDKIMGVSKAIDDQIAVNKKLEAQEVKNRAFERDRVQGLEQYSEAMRALGDRTVQLGRSSELNEYRLRKFALSFAGGNEELAKSADIMLKAKAYMRDLAKVEDMEKLREAFDKVADSMVTPIRDALKDLIQVDFKNFFRSLNSLIGNALRDISTTIVESGIRRVLNNWIGSIIGGAFGGGSGGGNVGNNGFGVGGTQGPDGSYTYPSMVASAAARGQSQATGDSNYTIIINATDAQSVMASADQIAMAISSRIDTAKKKL